MNNFILYLSFLTKIRWYKQGKCNNKWYVKQAKRFAYLDKQWFTSYRKQGPALSVQYCVHNFCVNIDLYNNVYIIKSFLLINFEGSYNLRRICFGQNFFVRVIIYVTIEHCPWIFWKRLYCVTSTISLHFFLFRRDSCQFVIQGRNFPTHATPLLLMLDIVTSGCCF